MNLLNLKSINAIEVIESETDYKIVAKENPATISCSHCGENDFKKFGKKEYIFTDIPINGKPVKILLKRQRYRCKSCLGTFFASIEDLNNKRNCTNRLIEFVQNRANFDTFVCIAKNIGVDEKTVRNIFNDFKV